MWSLEFWKLVILTHSLQFKSLMNFKIKIKLKSIGFFTSSIKLNQIICMLIFLTPEQIKEQVCQVSDQLDVISLSPQAISSLQHLQTATHSSTYRWICLSPVKYPSATSHPPHHNLLPLPLSLHPKCNRPPAPPQPWASITFSSRSPPATDILFFCTFVYLSILLCECPRAGFWIKI